MRRMIVALGALAGCASMGGDGDGWTAQGWARPDSFLCARQAAHDLGYALVSSDDVGESMRVSRSFGPGETEGQQYTRGYLTIVVDRERGPERLRVRAERYVESSRRPPPGSPRPPDVGPRPPGRPTPYDTTNTVRRPSSTQAQRVDPGPAALDARRVVDRCSTGSATAD